jgi:hypothetical protein
MSEVWSMMLKGAGVGAWVVGMALVLAVALPVFGVLFAVIAKALRFGRGADDV